MLFYAAWSPPFLGLLLLTVSLNYAAAGIIDRSSSFFTRKITLISSLTFSLGVLATFKYALFFLESLSVLGHQLGFQTQSPAIKIVLPVGISFYTFQTLSYTIDVYQRRIPACKSLADFTLYVVFFPQLVAGPIVRADHFLGQLATKRSFEWRHWNTGLTLLCVGLFQKVVLADSLIGRIADKAFDAAGTLTPGDAWIGTLAFAWQILFDFAGYSTAAIGIAMLFGFSLPRNFHFPYAATGFSDFWRRWHISLSTWLRDYLYIPLGGNRGNAMYVVRNLMITMALGGLWHGASWNFVIWGVVHGGLLSLERAGRQWLPAAAAASDRGWGVLVTFPIILLTWVLFRAVSFEHSLNVWSSMLGQSSGSPVLSSAEIITTTLVTVAGLAIAFTFRNWYFEEIWNRLPRPLAVGLLTIMLFLILTSPGDDRAFIYFQF